MIIESIRLRNFLSHEDSAIEFGDSPLWLISGENGAGKSAFFDAVGFALYGVHRGGSQQTHLLVKQGTERGSVEIVLRLWGEAYRIRHTLDHERGNVGSTLERRTDGCWVRVPIGSSARQVCAWLRERLPDEELFFSAIYLRQGDADAFMRGNAKDRMKRFAALLSLDRYTQLSLRAGERRKRAGARVQDASSKLEVLGDISDAAAEAMAAELEAARKAEGEADGKLIEAKSVLEGAKAWNALIERRQRLIGNKGGLQRLLADAESIRADIEAVSKWDAAGADLAMYWEHRDAAERDRSKAQDYAAKAGELRQLANLKAEQLAGPAAELARLECETIPAANEEMEDCKRRAEAIAFELRIAREREEYALRHRAALLLAVRGVVDARRHHQQTLEELAAAERACERARREQGEADGALQAAATEEDEREGACDEARKALHELERAIERLKGQVDQHSTLGDETLVCPTCAQDVGPEARDHLHRTLEQEQDALNRLEEQRKTAVWAQNDAEAELVKARERRKEGGSRHREAEKAVIEADGRLKRCLDRAEGFKQAWRKAYDDLMEHHPDFAAPIEALTATWFDATEEGLAAGLPAEYFLGAPLAAARRHATSALTRLETLRQQRAQHGTPFGETQSPADLEAAHSEAQAAASAGVDRLRGLETRRDELRVQIGALEEERKRQLNEATTNDALANNALESANASRGKADCLELALTPGWKELLRERRRYGEAKARVDERRENAARRSLLDEAQGRLQQIEQDLDGIGSQMDETPEHHRVPVRAAAAAEEGCIAAAKVAQKRRVEAEGSLCDLEKRRQDASQYRATIDEATEEGRTYRQLEDLLKEGGPLQVRVAQEEQRAVVEEVNAVLGLIDDPLRARLGDPQRGARDKLSDILVVDTKDPAQQPRYFSFLSGGERFRVALALALALHRRVDAGVPGTLIIDEGFGALDGERRDELARQLADTVEGLLAKRLAEAIIISSHSTEVQRHFPFRWEVAKEDGLATVRSYFEAEGLVDV